MKYVIYVLDLPDGTAKQDQIDGCKNWIKKQPISGEIEVWVETESHDTNTSNFLKNKNILLQSISSLNTEDVFVTYEIHNISKDLFFIALISKLITRRKCTFKTIKKPTITETEDLLVKHMVNWFTTYESIITSMRCKKSIENRKNKGKRVSRIIPYGYKLGDDNQLVKDSHEQDVIRKVTQLKSQGLSFRKIATTLEEMGYKNRNDQKFSNSSISNMLQAVKKIS